MRAAKVPGCQREWPHETATLLRHNGSQGGEMMDGTAICL